MVFDPEDAMVAPAWHMVSCFFCSSAENILGTGLLKALTCLNACFWPCAIPECLDKGTSTYPNHPRGPNPQIDPRSLHPLCVALHRGTTPKRTAMPFQRSTALAAPPSTLALRRRGWALPGSSENGGLQKSQELVVYTIITYHHIEFLAIRSWPVLGAGITFRPSWWCCLARRSLRYLTWVLLAFVVLF